MPRIPGVTLFLPGVVCVIESVGAAFRRAIDPAAGRRGRPTGVTAGPAGDAAGPPADATGSTEVADRPAGPRIARPGRRPATGGERGAPRPAATAGGPRLAA